MNKYFLPMAMSALLLSVGVVSADETRAYKPLDKSIPTQEAIDSKIGELNFPLGYPTENPGSLEKWS